MCSRGVTLLDLESMMDYNYNFCKLFIEDEKHFVLYCSKYDQCRLNYNDIFNVNTYPNVNPIKEHVNPKHITAAKRICCFLKNCFNARKESQQ